MSAAVMKTLSGFDIGRIDIGGAPGIAVLDRTSNPNVLVALSAPAGSALSGRWFVKPGATLQQAVDGVSAEDADANFPLSRCLEYFGMRGTCGFAEAVADRFFRDNPESDLERPTVFDAARSRLMSGGLQAVASSLNADAVKALACVSSFGRSAYEFYADDGERGTYRRQAAGAFPILAGEIAGRISVKMAVDRQKSPVDPLSNAFGVDELGNARLGKTLIKKLTGRAIGNGAMPLSALVDVLSNIPVDWFPKDEAEWNAFVDIADAFLRPVLAETTLRPDALLNGAAGKWQAFAERLAKSYADTRPPDDLGEDGVKNWRPVLDTSKTAMEQASANLLDVVEAFRNLIVLPLMSSANGATSYVGPELMRLGTEAAARFLFDGMNLPKMLELQRHWHTQATNIYAAAGQGEDLVMTEVEADGWPPLCDTLVAPNGLSIVPLTDPRAIEDEGAHGPDRYGIEGLHHCVGGYSERCRNGQAHILSVRRVYEDGTYDRVTTVDIRNLSADGMSFKINQNYGRGNTSAPPEAKEAMDWFREMVDLQQIRLNVDGVMSYLAGKNIRFHEVDAYCGYDWREDGAIEQALEPWRPYLPKRARSLTVDELRDQPEFADLLQSVAPKYRTMSAFA